jgi:hypothetical protein
LRAEGGADLHEQGCSGVRGCAINVARHDPVRRSAAA